MSGGVDEIAAASTGDLDGFAACYAPDVVIEDVEGTAIVRGPAERLAVVYRLRTGLVAHERILP